jgi:hypothetical protein
MDTLLLQDWVSISAITQIASQTVFLTQSAAKWLDVTAFEDLVFYLDVGSVQAGTKMSYQGSPSRDDAAFTNLVPLFSVSPGQRVDTALVEYSVASPKYVRWQLHTASGGTGPTQSTFRVFVAGYRP